MMIHISSNKAPLTNLIYLWWWECKKGWTYHQWALTHSLRTLLHQGCEPPQGRETYWESTITKNLKISNEVQFLSNRWFSIKRWRLTWSTNRIIIQGEVFYGWWITWDTRGSFPHHMWYEYENAWFRWDFIKLGCSYFKKLYFITWTMKDEFFFPVVSSNFDNKG